MINGSELTYVAGRPFISGNVLYALATSNQADCNAYAAYVMGVLDAESANGAFGEHARGDITLRQVLDAVFRFLDDFPELRDYPAIVLIRKAVAAAWPCT
jgi:hypothetical protein